MNWLAWDLVTIQIFRKNMFVDIRSFPPWNMKHERWRSTTVKGQILAFTRFTLSEDRQVTLLAGGNSLFQFSARSLGKWSNLTNIFFRWVGSTTNQIVNCHFFLGPSPSVLRDGVVRRSLDSFLARMRSHCVRSRKLGWRRIWILPRVFAAVGESYWKIHAALFFLMTFAPF